MTKRPGVATLVPMTKAVTVGRLWDLVQNYLDRQEFPVSERQLALKLGYASSSTFDGWRKPKSLPAAQGLARFAVLSQTPYSRVLDAALEDVGYLPQPQITDEPLRQRRSGAPLELLNSTAVGPADADDDPEDVDAPADPVYNERDVQQKAARTRKGKTS